jgi:hypothetical protein
MGRLTWLVIALAGCGDDSNNRRIADAPRVNADGKDLDSALLSPVTVTVKNQPGPTPDIEVYFQNADSTLVATAHTDANGTASAVMDPGGFVTLVNPYASLGLSAVANDALITWGGVKPGDQLVFGSSSTNTIANVTFDLPLDTADGMVASYNVWFSCQNNMISFSTPTGTAVSTSMQPASLANCGGAADIMDIALDVDNQPVAFFYVQAQPISDGDTIDYTAKTFTAAGTRNIELDNNASLDNGISISDQFLTSRGQVFAGGIGGVGGATVTTTIGEPALPGGALDVLTTGQSVDMTSRNTVVWEPTNADYTVDYATTLVGDFTTVPSFDTGTHILGWTTSAGAKTSQFGLGELFANRGGTLAWDWTIIGPSGTQIQFPTLPTDIADFTIVATDTVTIEATAIANVPGGYDAYRPHAFLGPPGPVGASGSAAYNLYVVPATAIRSQKTIDRCDVMRRWNAHL